MNVEYTGRQYEITPGIRKQIETALNKIKKLLGDNFDTHVILAAESIATRLRSPSPCAISPS